MLSNRPRVALLIIVMMALIVSQFENSYSLSQSKVEQEKHVLVLNSYHRGFKWTDDTVTSFLETIESLSPEHKYAFYIEYLDWKKYPTQKNVENMYANLRYKYGSKPIDLIVATDDKALELAIDYREEQFKNIPIVFTGVSHDSFKLLSDNQENITGVIENIDLEPTIQIAKLLNPEFNKIYTIHDFTESGIAMNKEVASTVKTIDSNLNCIALPPMAVDDIIASVKGLPNDSVVLITTFYRDAQGLIVENSEFASLISKYCNVPVFSLYDFYLGYGVIGGAVLQGSKQGELAAKLANDYFDNKELKNITPVLHPKTEVIVDYDEIIKYNVDIDKLPKDTVILNKPLSFRESNPEAYYLVMTVIFLLIILVLSLIYYTRRLIRTKRQLESQNEELHDLYEQIYNSEEELKKLVYFDSLTKLPNRIALTNDIQEHVKQQEAITAALMIIDIDNFKYINDTLGHHFGDEFLIEIAKIFLNLSSQAIRVYRIGGDEFAFLVTASTQQIEIAAQEIMNCVHKPIFMDKIKIHTTLSMGIAVYPFAGKTVQQLLKNADIAMYEAKQRGKERYVFFDDVMNYRIIEKTKIEHNLQFALDNKEFMLYFQPQYKTSNDKISGFEALIRWKSRELGMVPPNDFIKIAEESQKIVAIGKWVFVNSCDFASKLIRRGYKDIKVSVNISIVQLIQDDFTDFILATIESKNLDFKLIELEITETVLIRSVQEAYTKLEALRSKGVSISLDDFGTGYSSLSYLQNLPITTLKMDRAFVEDITKNTITENLASFIISMAHKLDLEVIAEGVETKLQLDILKKYNCDKVQGYYYSKPVPEEQAFLLLESKGVDRNLQDGYN
ncbi:putative Diguanylate cyclase/phosphodiesterase precursor [Acetoanaerobium sticklandii]|uniref:Putative Diguanylate cyclase/phosphodiesterase n=1 Tax=Acetoanaerobium sticklandii (strain ATCC 12662 / DSM 519 / JCM 1433 / CCUG 9281 / NCIMB 10654 / HF) TaxID=499177 RepID=E3PTI1_ACESD|nr:ABC transporter substrate binding protein [Acetoanaerobium sticklandii]CBH22185.1 putative Diguanylate cyclase/phosphodiesterase precursor [Acetoanaerobium sticklandii]